ncbi:MAG: hypothetical protein H7Z43_15520 [Clostridia bacterium]|nr:hypothetical protein [Deltaproteobacteria bacterium]
MTNIHLEYLLIAGNALARAQRQLGYPVTAPDVDLAAKQTAQQLVAAKLITPIEADVLVAKLPADWRLGAEFNTKFFDNLRNLGMLGVEIADLEPLIAGVSASIKDAAGARARSAAIDARKNVPAELKAAVTGGMSFDALSKQLAAAFAHPVFRAEVGATAYTRFNAELRNAARGLCVQSGALGAVATDENGSPMDAPLFTLPNPTTVHDLALCLAAADKVRSAVSDIGFGNAILDRKSQLTGGLAPGYEWPIKTAFSDACIVVSLEVTNIDAQLADFREPPARDQDMESRVAAYVAALGKSLMGEVANGTPLLQVPLSDD